MKNFTKQNFKTNPLWIRLLIMAFMLLAGAGNVWSATHTFIEGEYIFIKNFKPSGWGDCWIPSNGYAWAHMWGGTAGEKDYLFELHSGTAGAVGAIYRAKITTAGTYTSIIFTRNSSNKGPWDDKWNQTGDISLNATNNCATSFSSGGTSCTWSCYPTSVTTYNLNGSSGSTVKLSGSQIGLIYDLYKDNTIVSGQTKAGNGNSLTWTVTEGGTYTVKASNACKSATAMTGTYTYTPVTVTGYELAGFGDAGWNSPIPMTASNGVYTCTKQLSIDDYIGDNGFKILERYSDGSTTYYGNNGSMTRNGESVQSGGWTMDSNTSTANCGLYTDVVGNYTFSFTASTKKLTVKFPTACTPPTNNKKVVIKSTSRAYVYAWTADANETKLLGEWPGTQMSNTNSIEIPTETDVKIILNNGSGTQTGDIGPLTKGKEYTYQFTLGETTYKELRSTCLEPGCDDPAKPTIKINGGTGSVSTCGENGTLTIDANHVAGSYKLFTKSGSNYTEIGTISNKTTQVTTTGTYVVRAYNGECMTESDPITFTKNTLPTISTSTLESQTICENSSTTLSVKENMTSYLWSTEETTQSISVSKAGTYTVTATDAYGCESNTLTFTIEVNDLPSTPTFDAAPSYCAGDPITLPTKDNAGNSVTWYKQDGTAAGTPANTTGTYTYKAKATNANGCVSADYGTYQYTVKPKVAIAWNQASENMLVNNTQNVSTTLTGTGNVVYTSSDNTIIKVEDNKLTALKTGTATITATATGTGDNCGTATITKEVTVTCVTVNTPNVTASPVCAGSTATLTLNNRQDGVTYKLNSTSGIAIFGSSTTYTTPELDGNTTYKIYASHANACTNNIEGSVTVSVVSAPQTPSLSADRYMLNTTNTTATLTIGNYVNGVTYTLYKGENSTGKTTTETTFTVTEGGIYKVKGTNTNNPSGCQETEFSDEVTINVCPIPATPSLSSTAVTACDGTCTAQGYIIINNINDYDNTFTFKLGNSEVTPDANGKLGINSTAYTQYTVTVTNSCGNSNNAQVDIAINDNKPTITGNNSFQPGGSTTLTSDKGETTTWVALDGGDITSPTTGTSIVFTAEENGTYRVQATYNGCSTTVEIKVQDDLYVWVRRPIKKETAYDQFYHEDQNSEQGGDLFYKEFASLPGDYKQYNQGGKAAEQTCTDKDGYTWYGFVVSKEAIENNYYFTVHAPNDGGKQGDAAKYNGFYTHTYATQLVDMDADLYFVMDETPSNVSRGWNINTPVVVRASGDASFNGNNFADFVPLYVKDANICGKEVVSFEWQKSDSQNGTYTTYNGKSGEGINNIRTREAGWYRCVVTYGDGKGTATSNAIQVTNAGGTSYTFTSKLPILMVNTNGVGFPTEPASGFPSVDAENLKAKVSVDVIIKKGEDIVYDRKARMNYRGSSSLNFKKKSYAFVSGQDSCVFDKSRHDYVKTKKEKMLNLLGDANYTTSDKDWVLYAATPDPSMMRNRLVFDLYQQMRPEEWGVHSTYVELIVDGEYRGVYVFMDKITANEGRVNITNSDGFIVKYDKTDVADRVERDGDQKTFATTRTGTKNSSDGITSYDTKIDQRFEIEYPEKEDIEDAGGNWEAFYKKVQQRFEDFETALANKKYEEVREIIDYDSWADWFILSEFIKNQDGFRASNIFIYNGGKIIATPLWDQELSMDNRTRVAHGSSSEDGLLSTTSSVYSDAFPAPFWFTGGGASITGGLLNDPCFVALVKSKWDDYQAGVLSASNCSTLVAKYDGELDNNIRSREATKWPYTQAARGTTNSGKYMGYYNDTEGDPTHYSYTASKNAITSYATKRSTELNDNVGGLGEAIYDLNGETLIFNIKPNIVETYPWQQSIVTVNAPEGYEYVLDYSALPVGAEVKENGNAYTIKMPRPSNWETSGNGTAKKETYTITATIDAEGENSCGAQIENTATATINVNDVTEDCDPPIVKP